MAEETKTRKLSWGHKAQPDHKYSADVDVPRSTAELIERNMALDDESVAALAFGQWCVVDRALALELGYLGTKEAPRHMTDAEFASVIATPFDVNAKRTRVKRTPLERSKAQSMSKKDLLEALEASNLLK